MPLAIDKCQQAHAEGHPLAVVAVPKAQGSRDGFTAPFENFTRDGHQLESDGDVEGPGSCVILRIISKVSATAAWPTRCCDLRPATYEQYKATRALRHSPLDLQFIYADIGLLTKIRHATLAERSKALESGSSPKGRGFKSHRWH